MILSTRQELVVPFPRGCFVIAIKNRGRLYVQTIKKDTRIRMINKQSNYKPWRLHQLQLVSLLTWDLCLSLISYVK